MQVKVSREDRVQLNVLLPCPTMEVVPQVEGALTDEVTIGMAAKVLYGRCHLEGQRGEGRGEGSGVRPHRILQTHAHGAAADEGAHQISDLFQCLRSDVPVLQPITTCHSS